MKHSLNIEPSKLSVAKRLLLSFCAATSYQRGGGNINITCEHVDNCDECDILELRKSDGHMLEQGAVNLLTDILHELKGKSNSNINEG